LYVESNGQKALSRKVALQLSTHGGDKGTRDAQVVFSLQIDNVDIVNIVVIVFVI
jgi:hypothetical protein